MIRNFRLYNDPGENDPNQGTSDEGNTDDGSSEDSSDEIWNSQEGEDDDDD